MNDEQAAAAGRDPFLLRGVLWCETCAAAMVAITFATGDRFYGCPYRECQRQMVDAAAVEQLVWQHVALSLGDLTERVPTSRRRDVLQRYLVRVRVGDDMSELWYEWTER